VRNEIVVTQAAKVSRRERAIRRATLEELARSDYGALSFEGVARRAGVNKTTLYRRYPTKVDLVRSALAACPDTLLPEPSTGSLREDLLQIGRKMLDFVTSVEGQTVLRLRLLDQPSPELAEIAMRLHGRNVAALEPILKAAIARGELDPEADASLLLDLLTGALHLRLFLKNQRVDEVTIAHAVDMLLNGALSPKYRAGRQR